ncbi:FTR1 family protein [Oxalobacteraceae sp. CFBP 13730]|nr:FTR1 family protein [Oxalobacteraceae sp. CFBP 8763]MBD8658449.1 FTR1 family protein [Oxalobacteraceae sp. CFBP 13730]
MLKKTSALLAFALITWSLLLGSVAAQQTGSIDAKQLWQLLDYIAVDYGGAVVKGQIVSGAEYSEMLDFTENAGRQVVALPESAAKSDIAKIVNSLRAAVVQKADASEVAELAHQANALLVAAYPIPRAPKVIPDLARGKALYAAQCASCHGLTGAGNGELAAALEPKPIAFTDVERARERSVMALYQVISQGVEGTSMASYSSLSESDRWALAFFAGTMSHDESTRQRGEMLWREDGESARRHFPDLASLTTATESAKAKSMNPGEARNLIAYLRTQPNAVEAGKPTGLDLSRVRLQESLAALRSGDRANATRLALSSYLDGFEPIEPMVGARDSSLLVAVETGMLAYRSALSKGTVEQAEVAAGDLERLFERVDTVMGDGATDPMTTFIGALTILLREGVEALLIVIGIVAFLKKADRKDALRHVHAGWFSALAAGALTWVAATYLVDITGATREITEGIGAVVAALTLLSVGLWMHQKSAAGRWQEYLESKLTAAMTRRSAWALFALSFVAVYREVFETVLFYSALAADGNTSALGAGFVTAVLLLIGIAWALLRTSARMPIGKFFSLTSILVAFLAVVLIGKGASALQEAGWISVTTIAIPRLEWAGLYPTLETALSQAVVALVALSGFRLNWLAARNRKTSLKGQ